MNPLVKKEIRLLLPSWIAAVLLALVQAVARPYDFYVASLLFFGLTLMALTTIGREASLNTFSSLLAQPAERIRIWQTKLVVLAVGFFSVFFVWLMAFGFAFVTCRVDDTTAWGNSYNLFITICLIATATFTGGLWTTLLLRQLAGAFWLTLLVPAVLSGFSGVFLAGSESDNLVIAVLSVVIGIYSVAGFLFARWLFFRAQDVGWSGGVIALPEWKLFARSPNAASTRNRKPIFALVKKEFQLQQVSLMGAAGLLVLHLGVIGLRTYHPFAKDSAGEMLTAIFWMLWLVMAPVIGSMAVAEERRLGVMEGQLCLPVSRRVQFAIKTFLTLLLGIFLGGVMPMLLESLAVALGSNNPVFTPEGHTGEFGVLLFQLGIVAFAAWMTLLGFYGSTLAISFLQAVGCGIGAFVGCMLLIPALTNGRMLFFDSIAARSILPLLIAVPTILVTLLWLAYLNFKNFCGGWAFWRRNLLGFAGALGFIVVLSVALYNRAWEVFEPAEPAHGPAIFSPANRPTLRVATGGALQVQLPDGRVWFNCLVDGRNQFNPSRWGFLLRYAANPLPQSAGPQRFMADSNWVSVVATRNGIPEDLNLDTVGIQSDGTLWASDLSKKGAGTGAKMIRVKDETNWQQVTFAPDGFLLLKNDGTLWQRARAWRRPPNEVPLQIGPNFKWQELFNAWPGYARKADGSVWLVGAGSGEKFFQQRTNWEQVVFRTLSVGNGGAAYIRPDGTLWVGDYGLAKREQTPEFQFSQAGKEHDWVNVAVNFHRMVALKADGSLWQWDLQHESVNEAVHVLPARLGIHHDWVAIANASGEVVALAADGSLWLWPDRKYYGYGGLLKLPKQPQPLGNVFGKAD